MHNRIEVIEGLEPLTALQRLNLRANRIKRISGLGCCAALRHLELYENQLERLEGLESLAQLETLDVSFDDDEVFGLWVAALRALMRARPESNPRPSRLARAFDEGSWQPRRARSRHR